LQVDDCTGVANTLRREWERCIRDHEKLNVTVREMDVHYTLHIFVVLLVLFISTG